MVEQATRVIHQGRSAQRLVVRFTHRGKVTLNTAIAPLVSKDAVDDMTSPTSTVASDQGWLGSLAGNTPGNGHELHQLPDAMTDPFVGIGGRLGATLDSYRFSTEPRCLLDWAIAQTGLEDPLTKYTRHELEEAFPRFARDRDKHLRELVRQIKIDGKVELLNRALQQNRLPAAGDALQRAMRG